jgi:HEAT repeat protein
MAAHALRCIGADAAPAVPALVETLLADAENEVRWRSADALGEIGPKARAAVPILLQTMRVANESLAASSAVALGRIRADASDVVPALTAALQHREWRAREGAVQALGEFGPEAKTAIPALIEVLKHDSFLICEKASATLKRVGPAAVDTAVVALCESLTDAREEVRGTAAISLTMLDREGKSVPALIGMLRTDTSCRHVAARALAQMGTKARSAVPALIEALKDGNAWVRREAADALKLIDAEAATRAGVR